MWAANVKVKTIQARPGPEKGRFRRVEKIPYSSNGTPLLEPFKRGLGPNNAKRYSICIGNFMFFCFFGGLSDLYPNDTTSWHDCLGRHPKAGGCWTPNRLTPNIRGNLSRIYEPIGSNRCFQSLPLRLCGGWMMMMFFLFINPAQSTMDLSLEVACCLHFPPGVIASKMKRC